MDLRSTLFGAPRLPTSLAWCAAALHPRVDAIPAKELKQSDGMVSLTILATARYRHGRRHRGKPRGCRLRRQPCGCCLSMRWWRCIAERVAQLHDSRVSLGGGSARAKPNIQVTARACEVWFQSCARTSSERKRRKRATRSREIDFASISPSGSGDSGKKWFRFQVTPKWSQWVWHIRLSGPPGTWLTAGARVP